MAKVKIKSTGKTGTLVGKLSIGNLVELDGYESEKSSALAFKEKFGEFPNIVPWMAVLGDDEIEVVE